MSMHLEDFSQFGNLELLARQMVEGFITGLHKSPYHGFSVEFAEHRLYNSGESTRHIDWKVFAKTDRLYTKRYEEETNLRCHLVLDASPSMYYPQPDNAKIRFSVMAAAAITYLLHRQRDAVGLFTFSEGLDSQTEVKSSATHIHKLFLALDGLLHQQPETGATDVAGVLHTIASKIHRRSLVVIFSDMFQRSDDLDAIFAALQHLRHNKHEILIFHVTDQETELHFEFEDRPYEFIDLETQEKIKVKPQEVKKYYAERMGNFYQDLKLRCGQFKIDFIEADVKQSFDSILEAYFIKRGKMS